jgi:hypothetical protein
MADIRMALMLVQEIEEIMVPNKNSKRWRSDLHNILGNLTLVCGISMLAQRWIREPKELMEQLSKELEKEEEADPEWRIRIQEILKMSELNKDNHLIYRAIRE